MVARNAGMIIGSAATVLFVILVGVTLLGARLRRVVPAEHLSSDSKDAVKLALGLVATMTAILLGLLVSSAKSSFDTTRSEVMQMAAKVALLDRRTHVAHFASRLRKACAARGPHRDRRQPS